MDPNTIIQGCLLLGMGLLAWCMIGMSGRLSDLEAQLGISDEEVPFNE